MDFQADRKSLFATLIVFISKDKFATILINYYGSEKVESRSSSYLFWARRSKLNNSFIYTMSGTLITSLEAICTPGNCNVWLM